MSSNLRKRSNRTDAVQQLVSSRKLTADGADWLTLRMDPYHDFLKPVAGYPDADSYDTLVSAFNYEMNVAAPAGAAGNWDAHLFTLPFTYSSFYTSTITLQNFVLGSSGYAMGLVNVAKTMAGGNLFPNLDPVVDADFSITPVATFSNIDDGISRVIGMGIEVIDTTAEIYKQGSLACYRMPVVRNTLLQFGYNDGAGVQSQTTWHVFQAPPSTMSDAARYRSTVQWQNKDGAYMVIGQDGIANEFTSATGLPIAVLMDTDWTNGYRAMISTLQSTTADQVDPLLTSQVAINQPKLVNVAQQGIFLSGLNKEATFRVRVRVYVERAPLHGDVTLIPMATPSAKYDVKALEMYSQLVSDLPIAVPVGFNAHGDWWRIILRGIEDYAPSVGAAIGPGGKIVGKGVSNMTKMVNKLLEDKDRRDDAKKKAQAKKT